MPYMYPNNIILNKSYHIQTGTTYIRVRLFGLLINERKLDVLVDLAWKMILGYQFLYTNRFSAKLGRTSPIKHIDDVVFNSTKKGR